MNKFIKLFKAFSMILEKPHRLNLILEDRAYYERYLKQKYPEYTELPIIPLNYFLQNNSETINPYAFLNGGSLPTDLALLKSIAKEKETTNYLEIGSWRGESLANVAPHAKNCVSINLSDLEMKKQGLSEQYIKEHYKFSRQFANIKEVRENSLSFDFSSLNEKFDLIFVDGDHHYESVKNDTSKVFSLLKDDTSCLVWHDYRSTAFDKPRFEVLAGIIEGLPEHARKHLYHVENTLCAIYTKKSFTNSLTENPTNSKHFFKVDIEIKN